ncbi:hypothetical protein BMWSH_3899 [Priestia megaterium WSH-002]|uniref:Uncharacterized protein n=1 Tax=Priestia megaterium (strain WSH-002) TaxID=1006007 RepID=A0A8D3X4J2_PRIMW|nr:hypothetical protein BMWSH_3899 [Priestia megaterium WSH-002]
MCFFFAELIGFSDWDTESLNVSYGQVGSVGNHAFFFIS